MPRSEGRAACDPTLAENEHGAVAQLGEHLLCKQGVTGSIPVSSTNYDHRSETRERKRGRLDEFSSRGRTPFVFSFFNNLEGKAHLGLMRVWMR